MESEREGNIKVRGSFFSSKRPKSSRSVMYDATAGGRELCSCLQFPCEMNKYSLICVLKTKGQIDIAQMDAFNIHLS